MMVTRTTGRSGSVSRNPYSVNNVMDVSECDLVDVQALGKFNDNYIYIYP